MSRREWIDARLMEVVQSDNGDMYSDPAEERRAGMVICVPEGNANKTTTGFWEDRTIIVK